MDHPTPWKIGYSDGSGLDSLVITDAVDKCVVWGRTSLDPAVSGPRDERVAAVIVHHANTHGDLLNALKDAVHFLTVAMAYLDGTESPDFRHRMLSAAGAAQSAIVKAEGHVHG